MSENKDNSERHLVDLTKSPISFERITFEQGQHIFGGISAGTAGGSTKWACYGWGTQPQQVNGSSQGTSPYYYNQNDPTLHGDGCGAA